MKSLWKEFGAYWESAPVVKWTIILILALTLLTAFVIIGLKIYRKAQEKKQKHKDVSASRTISIRMSPSLVYTDAKQQAWPDSNLDA